MCMCVRAARVGRTGRTGAWTAAAQQPPPMSWQAAWGGASKWAASSVLFSAGQHVRQLLPSAIVAGTTLGGRQQLRPPTWGAACPLRRCRGCAITRARTTAAPPTRPQPQPDLHPVTHSTALNSKPGLPSPSERAPNKHQCYRRCSQRLHSLKHTPIYINSATGALQWASSSSNTTARPGPGGRRRRWRWRRWRWCSAPRPRWSSRCRA